MRTLLLAATVCVFGCSGAEPGPRAGTPAAPASKSADSVIPFETGFVLDKSGAADSVTIDEVKGDREGFVADGTYAVRGHYELRSAAEALLAVYVTNGRTDEDAKGQLRVVQGTGTFELRFKILAPGYPHVTFYPEGGGAGFAGTYFGSGVSVMHDGW